MFLSDGACALQIDVKCNLHRSTQTLLNHIKGLKMLCKEAWLFASASPSPWIIYFLLMLAQCASGKPHLTILHVQREFCHNIIVKSTREPGAGRVNLGNARILRAPSLTESMLHTTFRSARCMLQLLSQVVFHSFTGSVPLKCWRQVCTPACTWRHKRTPVNSS